MAALLVLSVGGVSLADGTEDAGLLPAEVDSLQAFQSMAGSGQVGAIEADTNPDAAETLPHTDLDRAEAAELLEEVFGNELEAPAEFFEELEVDAFRSDHVALVAPANPDASAGLLTSTLPLRAVNDSGDKELIDLTLEADSGELQPQNPLVEVAIPSDLSDGISLPDAGVSIHLASGDVERQASEIGDSSAFYPNVREETDVVVTATPTGVETYTHLRSPDAPKQETYELDLPNGSSLTRTPAGGAEVTGADGNPVLTIEAPWAIDAEGTQVPATIDVEGHSVTVSVAPASDAAYPILLDPVFESFYFPIASQAQEWTGANNPGFGWSRGGFNSNGLAVSSLKGATSSGSQGSFNYYVPRYWTDQQLPGAPKPQSYIRNLNIWGLTFGEPEESQIPAQTRPAYPFMQLELRDEVKNEFVWQVTRMGNQGTFTDPNYVFPMTNPNENPGVKHGGFALATFGSSNSYQRYVTVDQASAEVTDKDQPWWVYAVSPSGWMDKTKKDIEFGVSDAGLGVYSYKVTQPSASGGSGSFSSGESCFGTFGDPCLRTVESNGSRLTYSPATMAQGENTLSISAYDPVANQSAPRLVKVKVDHTAPALSLSGNVTEQATVGTNLREYTLSYSAKDGDDATATALTPAGSAGKGEGQLERPMGVAMASDGSTYTVDRLNNRVVKYDKEGKFALQFGSTGSGDGQFNDPRGIDIAPDGTVWVADMGNDRVQAFSPSGTFLRKAKFTDSASEPYAIASGPGGVVWVSDIGLHRLIKLTENPITTVLTTTGKSGCPGKCVGTALVSPTGVATDKFGNVWVADGGLGKILELDSSGNWLREYGTLGSGDGQIDGIVGIDVSPAGNVAITERNNGRVQIFKPDGSYLRKFGSAGSGSNQFFEPGGLSFGPGNMLAVADAGNKRVTRWSHADQDPQSGVTGVEVKVDGEGLHSKGQSCPEKNCSLSDSWTLDADDFTGGAHKVEVIATDAVGISQTKTIDIETHGDHTDPSIALSGTMTQQASIGTTRPSYKLKAVSTDSGPTGELKSGVASTVIKVDGAVVDSSSPGCPAGGCSITREWTLNSESYSVGSHTVEVKATDAAGRVGTKTLTIDIARDTTAPEVSYTGAFYSAPSGWLEQKQVGYSAYTTDPGYGVTSVELKIDGVAVNSTNQTCAAGGCSKFFALSQMLDMAAYSGGSHPAEFIAKDGAGNVRKRTWDINVDPEGHISATEATDTLEAVEMTAPEIFDGSPVNGLVTEEEGEEGSNPKLTAEGEGFVSEGTGSPSVVSLEPEDGFSIGTAAEDKEGIAQEGTIEVQPVSISGNAGNSQLTDGSAAVITNSTSGVDTVLRPAYDGLMAFQDIRTPSSPKTFSWEVLHLGEGETLHLIDEHHAGVFWDDGTLAMLITATSAHDADGKEVQTTLVVSEGNVLTLTVHHDVAGIIYPVVAGVGYEGGFQQIIAEGPPPTEQGPEGEEAGASYNGYVVNEWLFSAPEPATPAEAEVDPAGWSSAERSSLEHRRFRYIGCHYMEDSMAPDIKLSHSATEEHCGNPFTGNSGPRLVAFNYAIRGSYFRVPGKFAKHAGGQKDHIECDKMLDKSHYGDAAIEFKYFITETRCEWYGKTKDGEPVYAPYGKHITPYGEWNWGRSYRWDGPWDHFGPVGLALYIWASKTKHIGRHETTCIDCS